MNNFIPNSFQVPNIIVDEIVAHIPPNALKCYLVIVRKTIGWQKEWDKISTSQLMKFTGIKKKDTIYKAVKDLEQMGLIECLKDKGRLTSYRVVTSLGTSTNKGDKVVPTKGTTTSTHKGDSTKDTITKDTITNIKKNKQKKDEPEIVEPTKTKSKSTTKSKKEDLTELYANHNLKKEIGEFIEHRKEMKKPFSKLALNKFINLVDKYLNMGLNVTEMIDNSIVSNYQTIYAPKEKKAVQSNYGATNSNNGNIFNPNPKERLINDTIAKANKLRDTMMNNQPQQEYINEGIIDVQQ